MIRRLAFNQIGGYNNLRRCEDLDLFIRLSKIGKLGNIQDVCMYYEDIRIAKKRMIDSYYKIRVFWKYKKHLIPKEIIRLIIFTILTIIGIKKI